MQNITLVMDFLNLSKKQVLCMNINKLITGEVSSWQQSENLIKCPKYPAGDQQY